jgi:hypothetical protein
MFLCFLAVIVGRRFGRCSRLFTSVRWRNRRHRTCHWQFPIATSEFLNWRPDPGLLKLILLLTFRVRLRALLTRRLGVLLRRCRMLLTLCVIALAVMFRSSAMRFRCIFVMVGGFVVFVLSHWLPRFKFSMGSYQHPTGNFVPVVLRRIYRISSAPLAHPRIDRHPWTGRLAGKSIKRPLERCFMVHPQSRNC